jgi:hypothetical protein
VRKARSSSDLFFSAYRRRLPSRAEVRSDFLRESCGGSGENPAARKRPTLQLAGLAMSIALVTSSASADQSDMISEPTAVLQGLDKMTAQVSEIVAPVGKTVQFGSLAITVRDCEKNPPEDRPEDAAFLQINEVRPGEQTLQRFSGWMFAQSPALSSLENPVYDVILLSCKAASGSAPEAPGRTSGKDAE